MPKEKAGSPTSAPSAPVNPTFEDSMKELEDIVAKLERAEGPLEDQLKSFEKGVGLSRQCLQHLDEVEKRVEVLTGSKDGKFTTEPFAPEME